MYICEKITINSDEEALIESLRNDIHQLSNRLSYLVSEMIRLDTVGYEVKINAFGSMPIISCEITGVDELKKRAEELETKVKEYRACIERLELLASVHERRLNWKS